MTGKHTYEPKPLDTSEIQLAGTLQDLVERLAEHVHDVWALGRMSEGWTYGPARDDANKQHPGLVPYAQLTESEKDYDRNSAAETLRAVIALGGRIANDQEGV